MSTDGLVLLAETLRRHRGWELATVSTYAAKDSRFFKRLQEGSSCTLRRAGLIVKWFNEVWPEDLEWPASIPRPDKPETSGKEAA